jgi:phage regulator Rha-like protein
MTERLQKIGETVNQYKEALVSAFKDMDVEVKDWNFAVGKVEKQYNVDVSVKLTLKPKKT